MKYFCFEQKNLKNSEAYLKNRKLQVPVFNCWKTDAYGG